MEFRILGPLEVSAGDGALKVGGPKQRAVLAHLILRANRPVPVELLIDGLWGEEPPETAKNTLQTYVYRLRQVLGEERIGSDGGGYVLHAEDEEIDAARFETLVRRAKAELGTDPAKAAAALTDALELWRGSPLADLADEPSLRGEIARLQELHLSATEHRIAAEIATGGHSTVVSELEALTARYPLRERMWANLMLALYRLGRQAEALAAYQRAREVLADELGAEPSSELQHLHQQILQHDPALGQQEPPKRTVKPSRVDLQPGTEFAGYRIVSTLGRGGMAVVYLAEHDFLQRKVALKVLAPQLAEDDRFRERFVRESRLAASLDHPNVVPIYEAGASGGDLFIAMRYVEGTDLRTLLAETGALDPARAVSICRQVAAALDAAHEQGLVHRDVKPGNVLVARPRGSESGEHVYLSDFGLTKRSTSESGVTGTGQFVGTLDYAAPEQFQGGTPDARTDVYSLGCVLFECLTGHPPFHAENDAGLMYAHLQEQPPSVTADRPELPKEVDGVIARAMAKSVEDRPPSAGELADGAARALGTGLPAPDAAPRRRRIVVGAVLVGVAVAVGLIGASLFGGDTVQLRGESSAPSTAPTAPSPPPPAFRTIDRALSAEEGRLLTYVPREGAGDCLPLDRPEPAPEELAAIVCRTADVEVLYELFSTRAAMDAALQGSANRLQARDGECATDHLALTPYTIDDAPAGRVLCYTIERSDQPSVFGGGARPDQSHLEWTDDNTSIYAHAVRNDLSDLSLYSWWLTSSGPLVPGEGEGIPMKDGPQALAHAPRDGTYLTAPAKGCAGFEGITCRLHVQGDTYEIIFTADVTTAETGTILLHKPKAVVFSPMTGYCFHARGFGDSVDTRPAAYSWSAEGDRVTFERIRGGDCAGPQKLTHGPWTRAPGGTVALEQRYEVALVDPGGYETNTLTTDLTTTPNKDPDWSPDGSRIVFAAAEEDDDLYVMDDDGSNLQQLTDTFGNEYDPAWSPDGGLIAFAYDDLRDSSLTEGPSGAVTSIVVMSPDGGPWTTLVTREGEYLGWPAWSPDGGRIAFSGEAADGFHLYVMDADGSELRDIRQEPKGLFGMPVSWTPDGTRIVFWGAEGDRESLWSIRPDGTGIREVAPGLPSAASTLTVDWSPDRKWIVAAPVHDLTAVTSDPAFVYLIRADGSEEFAIADSGYEPTWRPSG